MRDPERIPRIIEKFERLWTQHPDIRLGQLISNIVGLTDWDIFYVEDDKFEVMLDRWLDAGAEEPKTYYMGDSYRDDAIEKRSEDDPRGKGEGKV